MFPEWGRAPPTNLPLFGHWSSNQLQVQSPASLFPSFGMLAFDGFFRLHRGKIRHSNLAGPNRTDKVFKVFCSLVSVGNTKAGHSLVELIVVAQVPRDGVRIAAAGM